MKCRRLRCDDFTTLTRSRVTNGKSIFIDAVDGRSAQARRFKDIYETVCEDRGGMDCLSEAQHQLARRASGLALLCELARIIHEAV